MSCERCPHGVALTGPEAWGCWDCGETEREAEVRAAVEAEREACANRAGDYLRRVFDQPTFAGEVEAFVRLDPKTVAAFERFTGRRARSKPEPSDQPGALDLCAFNGPCRNPRETGSNFCEEHEVSMSKQIAEAMERSKPLVADALKLGRATTATPGLIGDADQPGAKEDHRPCVSCGAAVPERQVWPWPGHTPDCALVSEWLAVSPKALPAAPKEADQRDIHGDAIRALDLESILRGLR